MLLWEIRTDGGSGLWSFTVTLKKKTLLSMAISSLLAILLPIAVASRVLYFLSTTYARFVLTEGKKKKKTERKNEKRKTKGKWCI